MAMKPLMPGHPLTLGAAWKGKLLRSAQKQGDGTTNYPVAEVAGTWLTRPAYLDGKLTNDNFAVQGGPIFGQRLLVFIANSDTYPASPLFAAFQSAAAAIVAALAGSNVTCLSVDTKIDAVGNPIYFQGPWFLNLAEKAGGVAGDFAGQVLAYVAFQRGYQYHTAVPAEVLDAKNHYFADYALMQTALLDTIGVFKGRVQKLTADNVGPDGEDWPWANAQPTFASVNVTTTTQPPSLSDVKAYFGIP